MNIIPVIKSKKGFVVKKTQFKMKDTAFYGLLKISFFELRNLTIIINLINLINLIKKGHSVDINIDKLDFDDIKVYEILLKGHSDGVFQF